MARAGTLAQVLVKLDAWEIVLVVILAAGHREAVLYRVRCSPVCEASTLTQQYQCMFTVTEFYGFIVKRL